MGEIAEMMLDGTLCEGCGVYMAGGGHGVPQRCGACESAARAPQPNKQGKVACKQCKRLVKALGLRQHMCDAHGIAPKRSLTGRAERLRAALLNLYDVCEAMNADAPTSPPTETEYQAAMKAAKAALDATA